MTALGTASGDSWDAAIEGRADLLDRAVKQLRPQAAVVATALVALAEMSTPLVQQIESTRIFQRGVGASNAWADHTGSPLKALIDRIPTLLDTWRVNGLLEK